MTAPLFPAAAKALRRRLAKRKGKADMGKRSSNPSPLAPRPPALSSAELWLLRVVNAANSITEAGMIQLSLKHRPDLSREKVRTARTSLVDAGLLVIEGDDYLITEKGKAAIG